MDTSFQTPSPDAHPSAATGQLNFSADNDQFIEDLFGPSSIGSRTLPEPRTSSSLGPTPASEFSCVRAHFSPTDPERLQVDYLVRLSTLAFSVAIDCLDRQDFSNHDFQRPLQGPYTDDSRHFPSSSPTKNISSIFFVFILVQPHSCHACGSW